MIVETLKSGVVRLRPSDDTDKRVLERIMSHGGYAMVAAMQDRQSVFLRFECLDPNTLEPWPFHEEENRTRQKARHSARIEPDVSGDTL